MKQFYKHMISFLVILKSLVERQVDKAKPVDCICGFGNIQSPLSVEILGALLSIARTVVCIKTRSVATLPDIAEAQLPVKCKT